MADYALPAWESSLSSGGRHIAIECESVAEFALSQSNLPLRF